MPPRTLLASIARATRLAPSGSAVADLSPSRCNPPNAAIGDLALPLRRSRPLHKRTAWTSALPSFTSSTSSSSDPPSPSSSSRPSANTTTLLSASSHLVPITDPLKLLSSELGLIRKNVQSLLGSAHPTVDTIAKYYFQAEGKHVRPMIVLLMSQATNRMIPGWEERLEKQMRAEQGIDSPISDESILNDINPETTANSSTHPNAANSSLAANSFSPFLLPTQRRLAEITEMIHVASLLHDDVIDLAATRRGAPSAPSLFGNKLSVLAGDFLLARASLAVSRLGSNEVVELVASVLANLVEGEVMQMKGNVPTAATTTSSAAKPLETIKGFFGFGSNRNAGGPTPEIFEHYMRKTYLKTASLIAKSSRASTVLGGCGILQGWPQGEAIKNISYEYGKNLGIAFQLIDDMLDFTASAAELGKPGGGADLKLGLATAPALFAWQEFPQLGNLIERKFCESGDVEEARHLISKSSGAAQTVELAKFHSDAARKVLQGLPESEARQALDEMARDTLTRKK